MSGGGKNTGRPSRCKPQTSERHKRRPAQRSPAGPDSRKIANALHECKNNRQLEPSSSSLSGEAGGRVRLSEFESLSAQPR